MREILLRGKPKYKKDIELVRPKIIDNDGFIYGSLVISRGKYFICINAECSNKSFVDNASATMYEVIPETVGQYTGLTDKNGKKIFEGDILKYVSKNSGEECIEGVVVSNEWNCSCCDGVFGYRLDGDGDLRDFKWYAVAGNIHDNPELLK